MLENALNGQKLTPAVIFGMLNLIVMIVGFGTLWGSQSTRIEDGFKLVEQRYSESRAEKELLNRRLELIEGRVYGDASTLSNRLTVLEGDIKYISQSVAELKLRPR